MGQEFYSSLLRVFIVFSSFQKHMINGMSLTGPKE